jgi:hypothetical protein
MMNKIAEYSVEYDYELEFPVDTVNCPETSPIACLFCPFQDVCEVEVEDNDYTE